jgi:hypothetical protein
MMTKRVCYIHAGPHKSGTSSVQWFLQEKREDLLKHGYFVPEAERPRGAHHALAEGLCGLKIGEHREPLMTKFVSALHDSPCEAIVISSEALEGLLASEKHADVFFSRIRELDLEPKLVLFPRNQPQWINSSYASSVKGFRRWDSFESCALGFAQSPGSRFSRWIDLAATYHFELIARPFTRETVARGVIPEFLNSIGINSARLSDAEIRRNEGVGPFTVSVARELLLSLAQAGKELTWLQATRCHRELGGYLRQKGLADTGYCGLTTEMARRIESELQPDNDAFAQRIWGKPWADIFAADVNAEFKANDFGMRPPGWFTKRRLRRAIDDMNTIVREVLLEPELAVEAPWNDVRLRSGLVQA